MHSESTEEANLVDCGHLNLSQTAHLGAFTSLTYDVFMKYLVIGTDAGEMIIWDMQVGKEVSRRVVDVCGLQQVRFQHSHALITLGRSNLSPIHVFDIRSCHQEALQPSYKSPLIHQAGVTSFCPHHAREEIMCGTTKGDVVKFDLRISSPEVFHLHTGKGE